MDEMHFGCVVSHPVYTYSANKKIEEELKQREKKLVLQQRQTASRIWKQKTMVFDDLIQIHVRTPNFRTKSTESEIIEVGDVKLDPTLYSKVSPRKLRQKRDTSNTVSPVLRVFGANVFCNMQRGNNLEMELIPRPRTRMLLKKTSNICKCLETLAEKSAVKTVCDKCDHDTPDKMKPLQRAHTFYDTRTKTSQLPQRRVQRSLTKDSLTETQSRLLYPKCNDYLSETSRDKPTYLYQRHPGEESLDRFRGIRSEYRSNKPDFGCLHLSTTTSFSRVFKRDKQNTDAGSNLTLRKVDGDNTYLRKSTVCLKRTPGTGETTRNMYVDSVDISRLAYRDKSPGHCTSAPLKKTWC